MYNGLMGGGFAGGGVNGILYGMTGLLNNAQQTMMENISTLSAQNGGMLDPAQMAQLQIYTQNYLAFIQTITSLIKQFGDLDKTIATNIGS